MWAVGRGRSLTSRAVRAPVGRPAHPATVLPPVLPPPNFPRVLSGCHPLCLIDHRVISGETTGHHLFILYLYDDTVRREQSSGCIHVYLPAFNPGLSVTAWLTRLTPSFSNAPTAKPASFLSNQLTTRRHLVNKLIC